MEQTIKPMTSLTLIQIHERDPHDQRFIHNLFRVLRASRRDEYRHDKQTYTPLGKAIHLAPSIKEDIPSESMGNSKSITGGRPHPWNPAPGWP